MSSVLTFGRIVVREVARVRNNNVEMLTFQIVQPLVPEVKEYPVQVLISDLFGLLGRVGQDGTIKHRVYRQQGTYDSGCLTLRLSLLCPRPGD